MRVTRHRNGFTLLEVVVAVGLMAIVAGMVFGIARTSLALGNRIVETQNEEMEHQAFFDLLGRRFSSLPGNTRMELLSKDSGAHYLSDLTLQNVPLAFTWGGEDRVAKAVRLSTVKRRSGFLDIVLSYYETEVLEGSEVKMGESTVADPKPFAEIILLTDVAYFEWRALDGRTLEWQYDWEMPGRLPLQLELVMSIGAKGEEMRHVFWIPPKQNPEVVMRQYQRGETGTGEKGPGEEESDGTTNPPSTEVEIKPSPGGEGGQ